MKWAWYDCGDNAIASVSGDTLFISRFVYEVTVPDTGALIVTEFGDGGANSIHGTDQDFPTFTGAPLMCEVSGGPNKPEPVRKIDLRNGGVKIICPDSIDSRGDINLNGLANEIADAVTFTGYFTIGLDAFRVNVEGQTAATEINGDGTPLTVADLVYLIRIIVGDALPLPKLQHLQFTAQVTDQGGTIATDRELGAALFVFDGVVDVALSQADLQLRTGVRQGNTYALVTPRIEPALIHSGAIQPGPVVEATGALLSVEIASYNGAMMHVATRTLPTTFSVMQNYPNPFNPRTIIAYDLPVEAQVTISIYNSLGRQIRVFDEGDRPAGSYEVAWDGSDNNGYQVSSGLYFYKVVAGKFSASRKMILLK
ncbi:MAG: FlgD immunoglobulin-like domain containing protein [Candidatus Zixiibacteriota bacterium]